MSCESEFRNFEAGLNSNVINGAHYKDSRISYTRESLLNFAYLDASKKLPSGFDCAIFSELNDACKCAPDKLPCLEWTGRIPGDFSLDSAERHGFFKLTSKDSRSIDYSETVQSQHSWLKPGNNNKLGSLENIEQNGILGSFSKLPSVGSEGSTSKFQGTDNCLLSRCNQPYRPPFFYKAMIHSGAHNHHHSSRGTSGCAECPSRVRSMEGTWRKDTSVGLEENKLALSCSEKPPQSSPSENESIEHVNSSEKASEMNLTIESSVSPPLIQESVVAQSSSQCQLVQINSGVVTGNLKELQGQVLEGSRSSAVISLEETNNIDAYCIDEASSDSFRVRQDLKEGNAGLNIVERKESRSHASYSAKSEDAKIHEGILVNAMGKAASNISAVDPSISSSSYVRPYKASNSQLSSVAKDSKGFDAAAKELHKAYDPLTLDSDCSEFHGTLQIVEEADASLDFNLPDEDSLITIDDTYIFEQDKPKPSAGSLSPASNKSKRSESIQNLSLADSWCHKSELNSRSSSIKPSDHLDHVNASSDFHDPWKINGNDHTPTCPVICPRSVQLPRKPHNHEPSDDYCPVLDIILSADPSMYHHFFQTPCHDQEPYVLRNLPLTYQATAKSMDVENRGVVADMRNRSTGSQFIQMQSQLAQLNIEAIERRAYHTASNPFRYWV